MKRIVGTIAAFFSVFGGVSAYADTRCHLSLSGKGAGVEVNFQVRGLRGDPSEGGGVVASPISVVVRSDHVLQNGSVMMAKWATYVTDLTSESSRAGGGNLVDVQAEQLEPSPSSGTFQSRGERALPLLRTYGSNPEQYFYFFKLYVYVNKDPTEELPARPHIELIGVFDLDLYGEHLKRDCLLLK